MKYIEEFRDAALARTLAQAIGQAVEPGRTYRLMEFCGGHTHAIYRYGLPGLLPKAIKMLHGPGCPVCVLPIARVDQAIELAGRPGVILCSYGDMLRVPGSDRRTLLQAKAEGADVRMLYSIDDAVTLARQLPQRAIIFFAIGFETTTPATALAILRAQKLGLSNFFVFCNHLLTPAALDALLADSPNPGSWIDGFIGPAHVSTVIGTAAYQQVARRYRKPIVIAGFEPLDLLQAILMLVRQLNSQRCAVENQYHRVVRPNGNRLAQDYMAQVFCLRASFAWRGLGTIAASALALRPAFASFDAERYFPLAERPSREHPGCACPAVLRGQLDPAACPLFAVACTPANPLGACMVSAEGACAAVYAYGRQPLREAL